LEEIEALPGIGENLAQRIIAGRADRPFVSLEDLLRIKGVTPKLLNKIGSSLHFKSPDSSSKTKR
jgi:DNA uptake protein ComE-like DNA-binding protein